MPNNVQRVINGGHQNVASTSGAANTHTSNSGAANVDAEYGISYVKVTFIFPVTLTKFFVFYDH
uniref:Bm12629 n=1 Tax=Brugia malayi TaxID=6279 RepID=A0A1I9GEB6_BRUMA|nr:Bm12629 [Brugia malayi]